MRRHQPQPNAGGPTLLEMGEAAVKGCVLCSSGCGWQRRWVHSVRPGVQRLQAPLWWHLTRRMCILCSVGSVKGVLAGKSRTQGQLARACLSILHQDIAHSTPYPLRPDPGTESCVPSMLTPSPKADHSASGQTNRSGSLNPMYRAFSGENKHIRRPQLHACGIR